VRVEANSLFLSSRLFGHITTNSPAIIVCENFLARVIEGDNSQFIENGNIDEDVFDRLSWHKKFKVGVDINTVSGAFGKLSYHGYEMTNRIELDDTLELTFTKTT